MKPSTTDGGRDENLLQISQVATNEGRFFATGELIENYQDSQTLRLPASTHKVCYEHISLSLTSPADTSDQSET